MFDVDWDDLKDGRANCAVDDYLYVGIAVIVSLVDCPIVVD